MTWTLTPSLIQPVYSAILVRQAPRRVFNFSVYTALMRLMTMHHRYWPINVAESHKPSFEALALSENCTT